MLRYHVLRLVLSVLALSATVRPAQAGKKTFVGKSIPAAMQTTMDAIDHRPWDALIRKYVNEDGLVAYRTWKANGKDVEALDKYLGILSSASLIKPAKKESKLAFWINAYNAVTIRGMLREYPTSSIRNHTAKLLGYNIWHDYQLLVGGKAHSLDQMEHKILRKLGDPRIHFAIVCASVGCPRLLNEAYLPARLNEQLETNSRDFFSRAQNFRHDQKKRRFYLSAIISWFGEDFGKKRASQLKTISKWLPTAASQQAAKQNAVSVKFLDYDWSINEQPRGA